MLLCHGREHFGSPPSITWAIPKVNLLWFRLGIIRRHRSKYRPRQTITNSCLSATVFTGKSSWATSLATISLTITLSGFRVYPLEVVQAQLIILYCISCVQTVADLYSRTLMLASGLDCRSKFGAEPLQAM